MPHPDTAGRVDAVRRFNRFYTRHIGVLQAGLLESRFSLTEVRVLYEIAHGEKPRAGAIAAELGLDRGYLSRILERFRRQGLLVRQRSPTDARQSLLSLTARGRCEFEVLDRRASAEVRAMLARLPAAEQAGLLEAMTTIQGLLDAAPRAGRDEYRLRPPVPGDLGWVVHRHGVLYAREYGWDMRFEALVAEIVARFALRHDPKRERCWIAERDGANVGCVFLVKRSKTVGQLRCLLVEPSARGLGIGARLGEECVRFARQAGYRRMMLLTHGALHAARRIYESTGFRMTKEVAHAHFGHGALQTWEMTL